MIRTAGIDAKGGPSKKVERRKMLFLNGLRFSVNHPEIPQYKVFPGWGQSRREFTLFKSQYPHCHLSRIILQKPKPQGDTNSYFQTSGVLHWGLSQTVKCVAFPPTAQWPSNSIRKEALKKKSKTLPFETPLKTNCFAGKSELCRRLGAERDCCFSACLESFDS